MDMPRSTIGFAGVTIVAAVIVSAVFSAIFGVGAARTLGPAVAIVIFAYKHRTVPDDSEPPSDNRSVDETENVAEQQQAHEQNREGTESGTPADELSRPGEQSNLLRSNEQIIEETEELLGDRITFYDDRTIDIAASDLNLYSEMMLHVVAKRIAHEHCLKNTSEVTVKELQMQTTYNKVDILLFMDLAGNFLEPEHRITKINYAELDTTAVTANIKKLLESAEWAINEKQSAIGELRHKPYYAKSALSEAQRHYETAREQDGNYTYFQLELMNACTKVVQYPVEIGYDYTWKRLTENADAALKYMADGSGIKTRRYLNRMQDLLEALEEKTDGECRV